MNDENGVVSTHDSFTTYSKEQRLSCNLINGVQKSATSCESLRFKDIGLGLVLVIFEVHDSIKQAKILLVNRYNSSKLT